MLAYLALLIMASADNLGSTPLLVRSELRFDFLRISACAAALTLPHNSMVDCSNNALVFTFGLVK